MNDLTFRQRREGRRDAEGRSTDGDESDKIECQVEKRHRRRVDHSS